MPRLQSVVHACDLATSTTFLLLSAVAFVAAGCSYIKLKGEKKHVQVTLHLRNPRFLPLRG